VLDDACTTEWCLQKPDAHRILKRLPAMDFENEEEDEWEEGTLEEEEEEEEGASLGSGDSDDYDDEEDIADSGDEVRENQAHKDRIFVAPMFLRRPSAQRQQPTFHFQIHTVKMTGLQMIPCRAENFARAKNIEFASIFNRQDSCILSWDAFYAA
jgi:hypothetical protein